MSGCYFVCFCTSACQPNEGKNVVWRLCGSMFDIVEDAWFFAGDRGEFSGLRGCGCGMERDDGRENTGSCHCPQVVLRQHVLGASLVFLPRRTVRLYAKRSLELELLLQAVRCRGSYANGDFLCSCSQQLIPIGSTIVQGSGYGQADQIFSAQYAARTLKFIDMRHSCKIVVRPFTVSNSSSRHPASEASTPSL